MPEAAPKPEQGSPAVSQRLLALAVLVCTIVAFEPVLRMIVSESVSRDQIRQSGILVLAAIGLVVWQHRRELHLVLDADDRSSLLLVAAYGGLAAAWWTKWAVLILPAFGCAIAGCLRVTLGQASARYFRPIVLGLALFAGLVMIFPVLDWPLRALAGVNSARLLQTLGLTPQLFISDPNTENQRLLLHVGKQTFHVATECNGFGLITSSATLALLLGGISGRRWWAIGLWMVGAGLLGFGLNATRIFGICLLAPSFPGHYHAMHETLGIVALWTGLGMVAWGTWRPAAAPATQQAPAQPDATGANPPPQSSDRQT